LPMAAYDEYTPVIPLPNPGEGGPVYPGDDMDTDPGGTPVIPLPNPGEGGPVYPGPDYPDYPDFPVYPSPPNRPSGRGRVRFLHAAYGYRPFRIAVSNRRLVNGLRYGGISGYSQVAAGYQTVTVSGTNGYIYLQKTMPFPAGSLSTIAVINTAGGMDLLQITDSCCPPRSGMGAFRVSNLARNSGPMDVLLGDGRVVYADVRFKETTAYKEIRPGEYQFLFASTNQGAMPAWMDIETLDSAWLDTEPPFQTAARQYVNVSARTNYTVFLLSAGNQRNQIQTLLIQDR
jgi:hypothetical protein